MAIWAKEKKNDVKYCKKGETAQEVWKIFEARHNENILKQKCICRTFCTFDYSKCRTFSLATQEYQMQIV
jgi:hypothetical protein